MSNILDVVAQAVIVTFGLSSIILIAKKNKWGFALGLATQPFWFITTYIHRQWGVFVVSFAYTCTWIFGVYEWFYKNDKKIEKAELKKT